MNNQCWTSLIPNNVNGADCFLTRLKHFLTCQPLQNLHTEQATYTKMTAPQPEADPSRSPEYEQGFAAGLKQAETKSKSHDKKIKQMLEELKQDAKRFSKK